MNSLVWLIENGQKHTGLKEERITMTEKLVNRIMKESNGSNLAAEIYTDTSNGAQYTIKYYINGSPAGDQVFSETNEKAVEEMANSWMNGIKTLYG